MHQREEMLKWAQSSNFQDVPNILNNCDRFLEMRSWAKRVKTGDRIARHERLELYLFNDLFLYAKVIG